MNSECHSTCNMCFLSVFIFLQSDLKAFGRAHSKVQPTGNTSLRNVHRHFVANDYVEWNWNQKSTSRGIGNFTANWTCCGGSMTSTSATDLHLWFQQRCACLPIIHKINWANNTRWLIDGPRWARSLHRHSCWNWSDFGFNNNNSNDDCYSSQEKNQML